MLSIVLFLSAQRGNKQLEARRWFVMAKDDYFVIVYKILAYLYVQLKASQPIDSDMLAAHGGLFHINESYHAYILTSLLDEGYIDGVRTKAWDGEEFLDLSQCRGYFQR